MQLVYGSYAHEANEANLSVSRQTIESEVGVSYLDRHTVNIFGWKHATSAVDLTTKLGQLEAAYKVVNQTLKLLDDNGSVALQWPTSTAIGGVRVTQQPNYPNDQQSVYATHWPFQITVEADYLLPTGTDIMKWEETLEMIGSGGPRIVHLPVISGPWPQQVVTTHTVYRVVQSGQARGFLTRPLPAPPIWPSSEPQELRRIRDLPGRWRKASGGGYQQYELGRSWSYTFEGNNSFSGSPTSLP